MLSRRSVKCFICLLSEKWWSECNWNFAKGQLRLEKPRRRWTKSRALPWETNRVVGFCYGLRRTLLTLCTKVNAHILRTETTFFAAFPNFLWRCDTLARANLGASHFHGLSEASTCSFTLLPMTGTGRLADFFRGFGTHFSCPRSLHRVTHGTSRNHSATRPRFCLAWWKSSCFVGYFRRILLS